MPAIEQSNEDEVTHHFMHDYMKKSVLEILFKKK
jgi:hypothetical protein